MDISQMSVKERWVAIATDILEQLKENRFTARPGAYFRVPESITPADDFKQTVEAAGDQCTVCALGAMVRSLLRDEKISGTVFVPQDSAYWEALSLGNHMEDRYYFLRPSFVWNLLGLYFPREDLEVVEFAFENQHWVKKKGYKDFIDPRERMRLIMEAIVENGGDLYKAELLSELLRKGVNHLE